jgi:hypothetical protein
VGSDGVVLDAPVLQQHPSFEQGVERLDGEQFVAEPAAEALHIGVLPGCAGGGSLRLVLTGAHPPATQRTRNGVLAVGQGSVVLARCRVHPRLIPRVASGRRGSRAWQWIAARQSCGSVSLPADAAAQ